MGWSEVLGSWFLVLGSWFVVRPSLLGVRGFDLASLRMVNIARVKNRGHFNAVC